MGGIAKPIVVKNPTTGQTQTYTTSTIGVNPSDPPLDTSNPSYAAQAKNDPAAIPTYTSPAGSPPAAPPPAAAPSTGPPAASSSGLLSAPGAYENWLKQHMGQLDDPTRVETMYNSGAAAGLNNSPLNGLTPTSAASGYEQWLAAQGGGPTTGNSAGVLSSLTTGPTSGPNGGNAQGILGQLSTGPTSGPNAGNSASVLGSLATGPSLSSGVFDTASPQLSGPGAMENFNAMYGGANGDLMTPGYTEQLYQSGIGQLDPYYDYATKRALQQAQTASSARGGFNSGLAAQQESDILGNLRGQQAQEWVNLAPQADAAKISREGLGASIANNAQSQEDNRLQTLSGIASAGDAADLGRNSLRVSAASNADNSALGAFQDFWNAKNNADSNLITGAHNADTDNTDAFQAEWNARNNADQNRITAGANADSSAIGAFTAGSNAQHNATNDALNQFMDNLGLASTQDTANRANIDDQFRLAGNADSNQISRLLTQGSMAKDLQSTGQDRILGGLGAVSGEATQEANLTQQILSDTASIDKMDDTQLQALAQKYGVSVDEIKSIAGDAAAATGLATKILSGGAAGGGGTTFGANGAAILD